MADSRQVSKAMKEIQEFSYPCDMGHVGRKSIGYHPFIVGYSIGLICLVVIDSYPTGLISYKLGEDEK